MYLVLLYQAKDEFAPSDMHALAKRIAATQPKIESEFKAIKEEMNAELRGRQDVEKKRKLSLSGKQSQMAEMSSPKLTKKERRAQRLKKKEKKSQEFSQNQKK
jgi:hypothetical protein